MYESQFNKDNSEWWASLLEWGTQPTPCDLKLDIVDVAKSDIPNRERLDIMIELLELLPDGLRELLVTQAKAIIDGKYKKEFRNRYNKISYLAGQCSTTSAFFSQIRQAVTYNDPLGSDTGPAWT